MSKSKAAESYEAKDTDIARAMDNAIKKSLECLNTTGNYRLLCATAAFEKYFFRILLPEIHRKNLDLYPDTQLSCQYLLGEYV